MITRDPTCAPSPYDSGYLYVMTTKGTRRIKIGFSTNPVSRSSQIAVNVPGLYLVGFRPGTFHEEQIIHSQFQQYRIVGEWFRLSKPVQQWLDDFISAPDFEPIGPKGMSLDRLPIYKERMKREKESRSRDIVTVAKINAARSRNVSC